MVRSWLQKNIGSSGYTNQCSDPDLRKTSPNSHPGNYLALLQYFVCSITYSNIYDISPNFGLCSSIYNYNSHILEIHSIHYQLEFPVKTLNLFTQMIFKLSNHFIYKCSPIFQTPSCYAPSFLPMISILRQWIYIPIRFITFPSTPPTLLYNKYTFNISNRSM